MSNKDHHSSNQIRSWVLEVSSNRTNWIIVDQQDNRLELEKHKHTVHENCAVIEKGNVVKLSFPAIPENVIIGISRIDFFGAFCKKAKASDQ